MHQVAGAFLRFSKCWRLDWTTNGGSTAIAESRFEDPEHCELFIMGYDLDEPSVLRAMDIETEFEDSETECEVCMVNHATGGNRDACASRTEGEPQAIGQEGN